MQRVSVESSSLDSVGFEKKVLEVRFRNGGVYCYFDVPEPVFRLLMRAESKGSSSTGGSGTATQSRG